MHFPKILIYQACDFDDSKAIKSITVSRFHCQFMVPGEFWKLVLKTTLISFLGQNVWLGSPMYSRTSFGILETFWKKLGNSPKYSPLQFFSTTIFKSSLILNLFKLRAWNDSYLMRENNFQIILKIVTKGIVTFVWVNF